MVGRRKPAGLMARPVRLMGSSLSCVRSLLQVGVDVSSLLSSLTAYFSRILGSVAGVIYSILEVGGKVGQLSITRFETLPILDLWSAGARGEAEQPPEPLGRMIASFSFRVSLARRKAILAAGGVSAQAARLATFPTQIPLLGPISSPEIQPGSAIAAERPKGVSANLAEMSKVVGVRLARPMRATASASRAARAKMGLVPFVGPAPLGPQPTRTLPGPAEIGEAHPTEAAPASSPSMRVRADQASERSRPRRQRILAPMALGMIGPVKALPPSRRPRWAQPRQLPRSIGEPREISPVRAAEGEPTRKTTRFYPKPSVMESALKRVLPAASAASLLAAITRFEPGHAGGPPEPVLGEAPVTIPSPITAVRPEGTAPGERIVLQPSHEVAAALGRIEALVSQTMKAVLLPLAAAAQLAPPTVHPLAGPPISLPRGSLIGPPGPAQEALIVEEPARHFHPQLERPRPRLRPISPTVQSDIRVTVSGETEEDLRDLEKKISRILSEQVRRYYGYAGFEEA